MDSISLLSTNKTVNINNLGGVGIRTRAAGWDARMLPLCYAARRVTIKPSGSSAKLKKWLDRVNAVARARVYQGGKISQLRTWQSFRLAQRGETEKKTSE